MVNYHARITRAATLNGFDLDYCIQYKCIKFSGGYPLISELLSLSLISFVCWSLFCWTAGKKHPERGGIKKERSSIKKNRQPPSNVLWVTDCETTQSVNSVSLVSQSHVMGNFKYFPEYSETLSLCLGLDQFFGLGLGLEAATQIISVSDSDSILRLW